MLRAPGLVSVAASIFAGILFAPIFQNVYSIPELFSILHYGPVIETGNVYVDAALAKDDMDHQLWTISPVILAVSFGGALEGCGSVEAIFSGIKRFLNKVWQLVGATLATSLFCDAAMCDQYLGIGIPAPLYAEEYDEMGLSRNIFWADGSYTSITGKTRAGKPAECTDDVRERGLACLTARHEAGLAPRVDE